MEKGAIMKSLEKAELKELLNKCWMTHDGMWFFHCMSECGMEKANKVNRAAIRSMSAIEIERIQKAFGISEIRDAQGLKKLFQAAQETIVADFMHFDHRFESDTHLHVEMHDCFAYKGMKRIGGIDGYECGIFERIEGWFKALRVPFTVTPRSNPLHDVDRRSVLQRLSVLLPRRLKGRFFALQ